MPRILAGTALVTCVLAGRAAAQARPAAHLMAQGIVAGIRADPQPGGGGATEVRLLQTVLMGEARWRGVAGRLTLNGEGLTLAGGEFAPGNWGEGFVDRRHPHTWAHEVMAWGTRRAGPLTVGLAAGKGFAPYGTDDPMVRPFVRYPVNHHLAQVLERLQVAAGARVGPVALEAALFNGDEPEGPWQWPRLDRLGDSWSARLLLTPAAGLELQGSLARIASPEHRPGAGPDHDKTSLSARWEGGVGGGAGYALAEWARTVEGEGLFRFTSLLAEGSWLARGVRIAYRFERTDRPEEERRFGRPFRSARPHLDDAILGVTRWTTHSVGLQRRFGGQGGIAPFVEVTMGRMRATGPALFQPDEFYGRSRFWSVTAGARLDWGGPMRRMGRYGVLAEPPRASHHTGAHP